MKKFLAAATVVLSCSSALAGSLQLQAQYVFNQGFNQGSGQGCTGWIPGTGLTCINIPGAITGFIVTSTIKNPGMAVLGQINCNGEVLWQWEHEVRGTLAVSYPNVPPINPGGSCWIVYEADSPQAGDGWEIQATVFYK